MYLGGLTGIARKRGDTELLKIVLASPLVGPGRPCNWPIAEDAGVQPDPLPDGGPRVVVASVVVRPARPIPPRIAPFGRGEGGNRSRAGCSSVNWMVGSRDPYVSV
jgi:hypothetical protein